MFNFKTKETRSNPNIPASGITFSGDLNDILAGYRVGAITDRKILSIPAVASAIEVLSGTISSFPLELHRYDSASDTWVLDDANPLWDVVSEYVNDELTATAWIKHAVAQYFITGRSLTLIERNGRGEVANLYPLDGSKVKVRFVNGVKQYIFDNRTVYAAAEIIDLVWKYKSDTYSHIDPRQAHAETFKLALAVEKFSSEYFQKGGLPLLYLSVPASASDAKKANERAQEYLNQILAAASAGGIPAIPDTIQLKTIDIDYTKIQALELKKHLITEIARIYNLPPIYLHDLSAGTYNNTEQQSQNFLKNSLNTHLRVIEEEITLKILGRSKAKKTHFFRFNVDEMLRGSLKERADASARLIQVGAMTPDEVRWQMNLPQMGGAAATLWTQGANKPLDFESDKPNDDQ